MRDQNNERIFKKVTIGQDVYYRIIFWVLFLLLQVIYTITFKHWLNVDASLSRPNIWFVNLLDSVVVLFFTSNIVSWAKNKAGLYYTEDIEDEEDIEDKHRGTMLMWILPAFLLIASVLVFMGFGIMANGKCVSIGVGNLKFNYYFLSYLFLFVTVPLGIDAFLKKNSRHEVLIISVYIGVISGMCIYISGGLMLMVTCAGFIVAYYLYQSKNRYKYFAVIPFIIFALYMCLYGVNGYFSPRYVQNLCARFALGAVPVKRLDAFLDGTRGMDSLIFEFARRYPLMAAKKGLGVWAVVVVIAACAVMGILLWFYINKFAENKRYCRFLLVVMLLSWTGSVLYHLNVWGIEPFYSLPFASGLTDFVWLAAVYIIFQDKKCDKKLSE